MLYVSIGIIGATVMPHNLYLHSSIVQTRKYEQNAGGKREAIKFATIDSTVALMFALFINARDPRSRGGGVSLVRPSGCGGNSGRLQIVSPRARRDRREHSFRRRAARFGTKLHAHRHARRTDRDGRIHQHPAAPVAAPFDHAARSPSFPPSASSDILAKAKPRNCSSPARSFCPCNSASPSGR